ncbi:hypothetical protein DMENIID0001_150760 [Sergentomyia squamirostris]
MEAIVNYSSEDEAEMENNCKKRDESSKLQLNTQNMSKIGHAWTSSSGGQSGSDFKKFKRDDTNYENVQMDMSEDSNESSSKEEEAEEEVEKEQKEAPAKNKSRSQAERKRSYTPENERETGRHKFKDHHRRSSRDYRDKDRGRDRDRDRERYRYKDHHSRKHRDSRRDSDRDRHRRRSSSRERKRRSSSREGRRIRHRSRSNSRDGARRTPEIKTNLTPTLPTTPSVGPSCAMIPGSSPPILQSTTSSTHLAPTVTLPLSTQAKPDKMDWRTQQRVHQLEKMGIDLKKTNETASIELPSYYNPGVVNPSRYAEQMQKRKLLWSHKKTDCVEQAAAKWETAKFSQDQDGKVASKFMRLMGIKDPPKAAGSTSSSSSGVDLVKKQEELFSTMEQQYEVARQVTHTMRGVGLGFSSQSRPY